MITLRSASITSSSRPQSRVSLPAPACCDRTRATACGRPGAKDALRDATIEEYGPRVAIDSGVAVPAQSFLDAATVLEGYEFERTAGTTTVVMEPVGVTLLITPWNSNAGSICSKLAMAIAAGCNTVIKPIELSTIETQIVTEALHEAGLPPGVINVLSGRGEVVGPHSARIRRSAEISFTCSSGTGGTRKSRRKRSSGPVLSIIGYESEDEAISIQNSWRAGVRGMRRVGTSLPDAEHGVALCGGAVIGGTHLASDRD
ncbi:aldehyde dehydrogenase family protein [Variovorax humicola]|uniref:Aldehyde dehydrogenase family protein n=1 Tax=Variovorax humicola TaxID=1769758 RepID=A0ABU8W4M9_9BURK